VQEVVIQKPRMATRKVAMATVNTTTDMQDSGKVNVEGVKPGK